MDKKNRYSRTFFLIPIISHKGGDANSLLDQTLSISRQKRRKTLNTKTKYPNIFSYETSKGKRYRVRRGYFAEGKKKEVSKSGFKSLAEARSYLAEIEQKIANNDFANNKNLTVDQYFDKYYEKRVETGYWSPNTAQHILSVYNHHFKKQYGDTKLKDLYRGDYERYINSLLQKYSRHTVRQTHGIFMAILNDAVVCQNLDQNPLTKIFIGDSSVTPRNKRISVSEFQEWLRVANEILDPYDFAFCYLTLFGLRKGEIVGLHVNDVTFDDGRALIRIRDSRAYYTKNGRGKTKTGKERHIALDMRGSELMRYAVARSHELAKESGRILGAEDFLYRDSDPYRKSRGDVVTIMRIDYSFRKVKVETGLDISPHMMRHFFATQNVIAGTPIEHLSAFLGHSKSYMTEKYTHIKDEISTSVADNFANVVNLK